MVDDFNPEWKGRPQPDEHDVYDVEVPNLVAQTVRLALKAAPSDALVQELKQRGVLEPEKWVEGLSDYPLYRINLNNLEEK